MENLTRVLIFIEFIKRVGEWGVPSILSLFRFYIHLPGMFINSPEPWWANVIIGCLLCLVRRVLSTIAPKDISS